MNIIKRINWWLVLVGVMILVSFAAFWYLIYLFVKLIGRATFGEI